MPTSTQTVRCEFNANGLRGVGARDVQKLVSVVSKHVSKRSVTVSFALLSDAEMRKLNKRYRKKTTVPNVLSFPSAEIGANKNIGEVLVAVPKAITDAKALREPVRVHVLYLMLHGFLHLLGYAHTSDLEAKKMEALEHNIMQKL